MTYFHWVRSQWLRSSVDYAPDSQRETSLARSVGFIKKKYLKLYRSNIMLQDVRLKILYCDV